MDGGWSEWSAITTCSETCNEGTQDFSRSCDSPAKRYYGSDCPGQSTKTDPCKLTDCPVDGAWSEWAVTSPCPGACGSLTQSFSRQCDSPAPVHSGAPCSGSDSKTEECGFDPCPIDGGWGEWSESTPCGVTCGSAMRTFTRACDTPTPGHGGATCVGDGSKNEDCGLVACPVDGGWTEWSETAPCGVTCGSASRTYTRSCTNPPPENNGAACVGDTSLTEDCGLVGCPVDGGWTVWSETTPCGVTCGSASRTYTRSCTNPTPENNGATCTGDTSYSEDCGLLSCIVNGQWGDWTDVTPCSMTCGSGRHLVRRLCDNPAPANGGTECVGQGEDLRDCPTLSECDLYCNDHA